MLTRLGYRSLLSVPLLREQQIMGGLTVWRRKSGEFAPEVVNLLQTFRDSIGSRDPQCTAVPRDPGKGTSTGAGK